MDIELTSILNAIASAISLVLTSIIFYWFFFRR